MDVESFNGYGALQLTAACLVCSEGEKVVHVLELITWLAVLGFGLDNQQLAL